MIVPWHTVLALALLPGPPARMDHAIGGKAVGKDHTSRFDARQKLYLYSAGD